MYPGKVYSWVICTQKSGRRSSHLGNYSQQTSTPTKENRLRESQGGGRTRTTTSEEKNTKKKKAEMVLREGVDIDKVTDRSLTDFQKSTRRRKKKYGAGVNNVASTL